MQLHNFYITLYNNSISLEPLKVRDGAGRSVSPSVNNTYADIIITFTHSRALGRARAPVGPFY